MWKNLLVFMVVPFFLGVIIHFLIPLHLILQANPKIEEAYNIYKIETEQKAVRALSFLNSKIVSQRVQAFQNILYTLQKILSFHSRYNDISETTKLQLNSAYELATQGAANKSLQKSMWFFPGTPTRNFSQAQKVIYTEYLSLQPYIQSFFQNEHNLLDGLNYLQTILYGQGLQFYFIYPSSVISKFADPNASVIKSQHYNLTVTNYHKYDQSQTIWKQNNTLTYCKVLLQGKRLLGTACLGLDIQNVAYQITKSLIVPDFQLSNSNYYLVKSIHREYNHKNPQIIANFTSNNLTNINIPDYQFFSVDDNSIASQLFKYSSNQRENLLTPTQDYQMKIQRVNRTKTYYILPIITYDFENYQNKIMYLIVLNNYAKSYLQHDSYFSSILVVMTVPSFTMLIVFLIVMIIVLKSLLGKLEYSMLKLNEYCALILKGDLNLFVKESVEEDNQNADIIIDMRELFVQIEVLNKLNKYSDPKYFDIPKPERIIRYLQAYKLFDEYGYNKSNICENIANCYMDLGDQLTGIKYIRMAVEKDMEDYEQEFGGLDEVFELKRKNAKRVNKRVRDKEKVLARKIKKLNNFILFGFQPGDTASQKLLTQATQNLKKLIYPHILNLDYIGAFGVEMCCKLKNGDFSGIDQNLMRLDSLISGYEEKHEKGYEDFRASPDPPRSFWNYMSAVNKMKQGRMQQAFIFLVRSLDGNQYHPILMGRGIDQIRTILKVFQIDDSCLKDFYFIQQLQPRTPRQYIFLIDVSNPGMSSNEIKKWKKAYREVGEYIYNKHIKQFDRISINEYCQSLKTVCNLVEKQPQEKILKQQLLMSFKCREKPVYSHLMPCFQKVMARVKNLQSQKYFIVFLKSGTQIDGREIQKELKKHENCKTIFVTEHLDLIPERYQEFFVFLHSDQQSLDRVLEEKVVKMADSMSYIF